MSRVLIYSQDRGGANIVGLVAGRLASSAAGPRLLVVAHPLSEPVFNRLGVRFVPLTSVLARVPADADDLAGWLKAESISHIICTTSSRFVDMTNCHLITAARHAAIPTLTYLDHWIGFDRFVDDAGRPLYLTEVMGCIDESCARRLVALGMPPERVHVVGHPHLESVRDALPPHPYRSGDPVRVCIVSQPSMRDRSFRGLFQEPLGQCRIIDEMASAFRALEASGRRVVARYRRHPKENGAERLPAGIEVDDSPYDLKLYEEYDVFVGATSMVLIEAAVAGRHTIRIDLASCAEAMPELALPEAFPVTVTEMSALRGALENMIDARVRGDRASAFGGDFVRNSLDRASRLALRFMDTAPRQNQPVSDNTSLRGLAP